MLYKLQIKNINRRQVISHDGPMWKFLLSDPEEINYWEANLRGAGVIFGVQLVDKFLKTNNVNYIVRAHQLILEGYKVQFNGKLYCLVCSKLLL